MKLLTWILFGICGLIGCQLAYLTYRYAVDLSNPHRYEYGIVWFWFYIFGAATLIALAAVIARRWRDLSPRLRLLLISPLLLAVLSGAVLFGPLNSP